MRQDYPEIQRRNAEVIAIGSSAENAFQRFWKREAMPFPCLPDPTKRVLRQLGQEFKWHKFGRMPALIIVDIDGIARWMHYGASASDIPENDAVLSALDELATAAN